MRDDLEVWVADAYEVLANYRGYGPEILTADALQLASWCDENLERLLHELDAVVIERRDRSRLWPKLQYDEMEAIL